MSSQSSAPALSTRMGRSQRKRNLQRLVWLLLPLVTFAFIVFLWWFAIQVFQIPHYLLPSPLEVVPRMFESHDVLIDNGWVTLEEIFIGFGLTVVTAIPLGLLIALSRVAKQSVYPILVFLQLVPKIAIAPLFLVWVGFGIESKILLTILMTFFPLLLSSISGFQILDQRFLHLTKSMGASGWQTFRYLRFPAALPVIFSGLKASATIAATAAVVAEFVGANKGLGYLLLQATGTLDTTLIFAIVLLLTIIGIALNYIVELIEYVLAPWQRARISL